VADAFIASLCERVGAAAARGEKLRIRGAGTKDFYGNEIAGTPVDMSAYSGIVAYEPKELVLSVRAGTPLAEVEAALAQERQMLAFEPPHFSEGATIGGTVAAGMSGPRRAFAGAVRDFVLGTRIVNGKGEDLSFGGRVIKNVAGYDVSRLMAGALGTLGIITEISFKVLPRPPAETTLLFELDEASAIAQCNRWSAQPLPLSATAWQSGTLRVRLSGAESAVRAAMQRMGGEDAGPSDAYWTDLREHRLDFFRGGDALWRMSVAQTAEPFDVGASQFIEWGGGLRWVRGNVDALTVRTAAERAGGHATLFRGGDKSVGAFHPLQPALLKIHRRLKAAFDPAGIFNPGRFYEF
jgi:glycolate oxidase FAD binding subunit